MNQILAAVLYLIGASIFIQMLLQGLSRRVDLFSLRNFFFVGLVVYQVTNAAKLLWTERSDPYYELQDMTGTGTVYIMALLFFLAVFNWLYMRGRTQQIEREARTVSVLHVSLGAMLTMSVVFVTLGLAMRFTFQYMGQFGLLVDLVGLGLLAMAAGMAGWAWMSHFWSLPAAVISLGVFAAALSKELGDFGRRDLLGIAAAFVFGAYHGAWKHRGPRKALRNIAIAGLCAFVLLSAHTAVRVAFNTTSQLSFGRIVEKLLDADVTKGAADVASGQDAASISLWLMETRSKGTIPYDFLHSAKTLATYWIPRIAWEDKPIALALQVPKQAGVTKVAAEYNVGPGLIGHMWNDNPYIALPLYSVLLALAFRWIDGVMNRNPNNPFIILPIGAALGQFIGLARGELASFSFRAIVYMLAAFVTMQVLYRFLASLGLRMRVETHPLSEVSFEYPDGVEYGDTPPEPAALSGPAA